LDGIFELYNPDGQFNHKFTINAGTFDNLGLIKLTGYLPGTSINFGSGATVNHKGKAVTSGLAEPTWVQPLQNGALANAVANKLGPQGLLMLAANASMYLAARLGNIGVGSCVNLNGGLGLVTASVGVCIVIGPDGTEAVALSVSAGGAVAWPSQGKWKLSDLFVGAEFTADA